VARLADAYRHDLASTRSQDFDGALYRIGREARGRARDCVGLHAQERDYLLEV
jgi:hypothetical protein